MAEQIPHMAQTFMSEATLGTGAAMPKPGPQLWGIVKETTLRREVLDASVVEAVFSEVTDVTSPIRSDVHIRVLKDDMLKNLLLYGQKDEADLPDVIAQIFNAPRDVLRVQLGAVTLRPMTSRQGPTNMYRVLAQLATVRDNYGFFYDVQSDRYAMSDALGLSRKVAPHFLRRPLDVSLATVHSNDRHQTEQAFADVCKDKIVQFGAPVLRHKLVTPR